MVFDRALPIWAQSDAKDYNQLYGFILRFDCGDNSLETMLKIAVCDTYRCYINGVFTAAGPSRTAKNYYRIDSLNVTDKIVPGQNTFVFFAAAYNVNSFEFAGGKPFIQAEVLQGNKAVCYTDTDTIAFYPPQYTREVNRYSFQRTFAEVWDFSLGSAGFYSGHDFSKHRVEVTQCPAKNFIERSAPYPSYPVLKSSVISSGDINISDAELPYPKFIPDFTMPSKTFKAYRRKDLKCDLLSEVVKFSTMSFDHIVDKDAFSLSGFKLYDFGINAAGFISLEVDVTMDCDLYILFDEILVRGDVDPFRLNCLNAVKFNLGKGSHKLMSFNAYTMRYAKVFCVEGTCVIKKLNLIEYSNPIFSKVYFSCSNEKLNRIFAAAVNTYRFNAVDIFTDCPSRERAGWLCDSYFLGRAEKALTGRCRVEKDFLQNYLCHSTYERLPPGMVPMCYPAQHRDGNFIPTWAMWLVLELQEYLADTQDIQTIKQFKGRIMRMLQYFEQFENEFNLLEDLPGWIFIEWSKANELVFGVNACVNMLYAKTLFVAGKLYNDVKLCDKAESIRAEINKLFFDGTFYKDQAVRENGKLSVREHRTEVCQYYALFTDTAHPKTDSKFWERMVTEFGPDRHNKGIYPEVYPTNLLVGKTLRLLLLDKYGYAENVINEIIEYFSYMADKTGTLWENDTDSASCNHGFASYVAHLLLKNVAGYQGEHSDVSVGINPSSAYIDFCVARFPIAGDKQIYIRWQNRHDGKIAIERKIY